jgi:aspartate/methionine/tyrosine aminotransferase
MLREAGVAVSSGVDFYRTRGNRFVRFSDCGPEEDMRAAAERLVARRSASSVAVSVRGDGGEAS